MPERDELDQLIDSALVRYAEPRAGLEQRILAHVEAKSLVRSWLFRGWQRWAMTGAVAFAILLGIARLAHYKASVNTAGVMSPDHSLVTGAEHISPETQIHLPPSRRAAKKSRTVTHRPKSIDVAERVQYPKLDVFPAPQALSAHERSLVEFATHLPKDEREELLADQNNQDKPLEISLIRISPLTMPDMGKN